MKILMSVTVTYDPKGTPATPLMEQLQEVIDRAHLDGRITGDFEAEVESYSVSMVVLEN